MRRQTASPVTAMRWKWSSSPGEVFNEQLFAELEQLQADLEEVITNLTNQQTVHHAVLASAGRIMQTTLLDFLR